MRFSLFILLLFSMLLGSCTQWKFVKYRRSDKEYIRKSKKAETPISTAQFWVNNREMRFISFGDTNLPALVLIHGSPGSIKTYDALVLDTAITHHFRVIAMDRLGYGYSGLRHPDTSVLQQAKDILWVLNNHYHVKNYLLLGYSFGGPVAATMAGLDSLGVKHLFLVSAAMAPGAEKIYGVSYLINKRLFRWFVPGIICSANIEKLSHYSALETVVPIYKKIRCGVTMYQGEDDELIYPENTDFFKQVYQGKGLSVITKPGGHNAFIWKSKETIVGDLFAISAKP
ncbi:MAG: alpha/beta hydrolase [Bacteroidia bacterium]|nr:alpha/beta hydrolase [Bacteroidia bacterium]